MGQDKALLPIQGVPLLELVFRIASALCEPVYVVTPWPERYQDLLPASCQFIREVPLPGKNTGDVTSSSSKVTLPLTHGPLVGFAQGLAEVKTDWVLLLACDLPRLQVEVLQEWADRLDSVEEEALALLTHHAKGWDPLCGFYRRSCLSALTEYINQGGRSFQHWLAQHPVQLLPLPDAQMLFNCNTPADFASLEKFR
jgi:molybdopterin-guanine dinucleotide biosynthesis protein A